MGGCTYPLELLVLHNVDVVQRRVLAASHWQGGLHRHPSKDTGTPAHIIYPINVFLLHGAVLQLALPWVASITRAKALHHFRYPPPASCS